MKKILCVVLLLMLVCLSGCGKNRNETLYEESLALFQSEKYAEAQLKFEALGDYKDSISLAHSCATKQDPVGALQAYLETHGTATDVGGKKMYMPSDIPNTELVISTQPSSVTLSITYHHNVKNVNCEYQALFDIVGDSCGAIVQSNSISAGGSKVSSVGTGSVDLSGYTVGTAPVIDQFYSNIPGAGVSDGFLACASDSIDTLLEEFSVFITQIDPSLCLKDFGLLNYQVDPSRVSAIRLGEIPGSQ